jgi:hypothetical protein
MLAGRLDPGRPLRRAEGWPQGWRAWRAARASPRARSPQTAALADCGPLLMPSGALCSTVDEWWHEHESHEVEQSDTSDGESESESESLHGGADGAPHLGGSSSAALPSEERTNASAAEAFAAAAAHADAREIAEWYGEQLDIGTPWWRAPALACAATQSCHMHAHATTDSCAAALGEFS